MIDVEANASDKGEQYLYEFIPNNPYLLLTPGPVSTSKRVRNALLQDWCTWDEDYNLEIVQNIRKRLVKIATTDVENYTAVLLQGSGSFAVEACLGTVVPKAGKVLIIINGAYGRRIATMAKILNIDHTILEYDETQIPEIRDIEELLKSEQKITHVVLVHCETTTGILNPLEDIAKVVKKYDKILIVDAMSSFGGIPMDISRLNIDYLISSSNKCIQGVPGFSFVIAKRDELVSCKGNARSLVLDLVAQWEEMDQSGKWRYTSPTHVVRAFYEAINELESEGGVDARYERYCENHKRLWEGMCSLGFKTLLPLELQAPIITSFLLPYKDFGFKEFYANMKEGGFVLYPGKISKVETFRVGNIGDVYPKDIEKLIEMVNKVIIAKDIC